MPHELVSSFVHKFFPNLEQKIKRTVTVPVVRTLTSHHVESGQQGMRSRPVTYITFDALVGRNSTFHDLTHEQIEELCGVEFKALNCLVWIVPCVRFHPVSYSLTLTTPRASVLLDHPGCLVYYHCILHISSEVETKLCSSQPPFKSLTGVVRVMAVRRTMVNSPLQVFVVPGRFRLHEYGDVIGRPIYGPLPTSLPYDCHLDLSDYCREHWFCEFSYPCSQHVALIYFS